MRILITGAAGFLGSHLCDRLLTEGHEIIGMDNFVTGNPGNISHLMANDKFSFFKHDVSNYIFIQGKVDAVLHFASPASRRSHSWMPAGNARCGRVQRPGSCAFRARRPSWSGSAG